VSVDDSGATPIALLIHELATNASKYGAMSRDTGRVELATAVDGEFLIIRWKETGGPRVDGPPQRTGFGSKLTELSIVQQLGGSIERAWEPAGLTVEARVLKDRLVRSFSRKDEGRSAQ
jgi:two-component sensor histidine kinase